MTSYDRLFDRERSLDKDSFKKFVTKGIIVFVFKNLFQFFHQVLQLDIFNLTLTDATMYST